jgi:hypothetical protein
MGVILSLPPMRNITDNDENRHVAKSIAFQVLRIFILDCKEFVSKAVQKSIAEQVAAPPPIRYHGDIREEALKTWKKEEHALSWGNQATASAETSSSNYRSLVILLSKYPDRPSSGLVKSTDRWSYERMAKHMVEYGIKGYAPASKHGYFRTALELAYTEIKKYSPEATKADDYAIWIIAYMMEKMKIHFVPWYPPSSHRSNAGRLAHHDHWIFLDHTSSASPLSGTKTIDNPSPRTKYTRIANRDSAADPCAPWAVPDSIQDMGPLWSKATLPTDWNLSHATIDTLPRNKESDYVHKTYEYVARVYDGKNWKHHIALVLAILVSEILPNVFYPKDRKAKINRLTKEEEITQAVTEFPWVETTSSQKGVTARKPYITMLTTAILALLDEESPLRKYIAENKKFGDIWTKKHG